MRGGRSDESLETRVVLGRQDFAEKLRRDYRGKDSVGEVSGISAGAAKAVARLEEAERLVSGGIKAAELAAKELERLPGGDPRRWHLRSLVRQTTAASCG
jgi:hypothetical protein